MNATPPGLPVIRMCQRPDCAGVACPDSGLPSKHRMIALAEAADSGVFADDDAVLRFMRQELALSGCSDSGGVMHHVPAVEFTVHKGWGPWPVQPGRDCYVAVYSGEADVDEILAGTPEWSHDGMLERSGALTAA